MMSRKQEPETDGPSRRPDPSPRGRILSLPVLGVCAVLVTLCLLIYLPWISNKFIMDDDLYILRNPNVLKGFSAGGIKWAFSTFKAGNWNPLTWFSHMLDVELFGLDPRGHHLVSLLWHAANAALLFLLVRGYTGAFWKSAFTAALFAVHPLHVESVAWAAERKDVLSTFLWFSALAAYLTWVRKPRASRYLAVALLFAASLMAKPMPVSLPCLLLLLDWWPLGRWLPAAGQRGGHPWPLGRLNKSRLSALVAEKLPLMIPAAAIAAVTILAQKRTGSMPLVPFGYRLANVGRSYFGYLIKTVWPAHLAIFYPFPNAQPSAWKTAAMAAGIILVMWLAFMVRRRCPALAAGWFWYLGTLVPVIGLVQVGTQAMADRYTYVPLVGIFIMAAWGVEALTAGWKRRTLPLAAGSLLLVAVLAVMAAIQTSRWKDPATAFSHALRVTSNNHIAHLNLAQAFMAMGNERAAKENLLKAIAIDDSLPEAHTLLGVILINEGKYKEAKERFLAALRLNPDYGPARGHLGIALGLEGRMDEAREQFREADRLLSMP